MKQTNYIHLTIEGTEYAILPLQWDTLECEREDDCDHAEAAAEGLHLGRVLLPSPTDDAAVGQADLGRHDDGHQGRAAAEHA